MAVVMCVAMVVTPVVLLNRSPGSPSRDRLLADGRPSSTQGTAPTTTTTLPEVGSDAVPDELALLAPTTTAPAPSTSATTRRRTTTTTARRSATTTTVHRHPATTTTTAAARVTAPPTTAVTTTTTTKPPATTTTTAKKPTAAAPAAAPSSFRPTRQATGTASWFNAPDGTCAHLSIPKGTTVRVTRLSTGASTFCRIGDYGPSDTSRVIDLSMDTFAKLADPSLGLIEVRIEW